jgi:hypothetical protein
LHGLLGIEGLTLGQFIDETYAPWAKATRPRTAKDTLEKLNRLYGSWLREPLSSITVERIEAMKVRRLNASISPNTVLREIFTLSGVLSRAVKLGKLAVNPVRWVEKPRIDRRPKVRFLDEDEESRLRAALHARDTEMRNLRVSRNARRQQRQRAASSPASFRRSLDAGDSPLDKYGHEARRTPRLAVGVHRLRSQTPDRRGSKGEESPNTSRLLKRGSHERPQSMARTASRHATRLSYELWI